MKDDIAHTDEDSASMDDGESTENDGTSMKYNSSGEEEDNWMQPNKNWVSNPSQCKRTQSWIGGLNNLEGVACRSYYQTHSTSDSTSLEYSGHFSTADEFGTSPPPCACIHSFTRLTYPLLFLILQLDQHHSKLECMFIGLRAEIDVFDMQQVKSYL